MPIIASNNPTECGPVYLGPSNFTHTSQLVNDGDNTVDPFLSATNTNTIIAAKTSVTDSDFALTLDASNFGKLKKTSWLNIYFTNIRAKVLSEIVSALMAFKVANFLDATSSIQSQLDSKPTMVSGVIQSFNLPSYVDDVIEAYLFAGIFYKESSHTTIITGELGKIYIDLTSGQSNKQYRYSGSVYIQITNGLIASTNDVPEGTNLYYTDERVKALISGTTSTIPKFKSGGGVEDSAISENSTNVVSTKKIKGFKAIWLEITENGFTGLFGNGEEGTPGYVNSIMSKWRTNFYGSLFDFSVFRNDSADLVKAEMLFNEIMKFRFERNGNFTATGTATASPATTSDHLITKGQVISEINELVDDIESNFTPLVVPTATNNSDAVNLQQLNENLGTFSVVNTTTVDLDLSYLNTNYPTARIGFEVLCPYKPIKPGIYKKMDNASGGVWHFIYSENIT